LVEAGVTRLRPIVMTTLAMIVGMIPIALGTGEGGELRAPMARAVIGGPIVVPVVCAYLNEAGVCVKRLRARRGSVALGELAA
jgi:HAE1 family hydrophobic/amphiphilic exporter-1